MPRSKRKELEDAYFEDLNADLNEVIEIDTLKKARKARKEAKRRLEAEEKAKEEVPTLQD